MDKPKQTGVLISGNKTTGEHGEFITINASLSDITILVNTEGKIKASINLNLNDASLLQDGTGLILKKGEVFIGFTDGTNKLNLGTATMNDLTFSVKETNPDIRVLDKGNLQLAFGITKVGPGSGV
jgi:hypothetical protein